MDMAEVSIGTFTKWKSTGENGFQIFRLTKAEVL